MNGTLKQYADRRQWRLKTERTALLNTLMVYMPNVKFGRPKFKFYNDHAPRRPGSCRVAALSGTAVSEYSSRRVFNPTLLQDYNVCDKDDNAYDSHFRQILYPVVPTYGPITRGSGGAARVSCTRSPSPSGASAARSVAPAPMLTRRTSNNALLHSPPALGFITYTHTDKVRISSHNLYFVEIEIIWPDMQPKSLRPCLRARPPAPAPLAASDHSHTFSPLCGRKCEANEGKNEKYRKLARSESVAAATTMKNL
ncbi:hypothetical protein EVAR_17671_1 [Eumeta japonica]|uniref:Uncharacterized protein n=1 Tax=Eumeta variegata TaxID=151549 RepID=A0A4C1UTI5_EUMVA|nr:hypothetical protein EVAR_17671_1 [Eumeta japonica]